jgi:hypothetical protein
MTKQDETLPLTYLLSPPASMDEIVMRAELVGARWTQFAGVCQQLVEQHVETVQASTVMTLEQLRRNAMEAAFLSSGPKAESIEVS